MIALIQRVSQASVRVDQKITGQISKGLLVFLGIEQGDNKQKTQRLSERILGYRIFADADNKMNLNVKQINGELLVVSQFTLVADTQKGMRPSFSKAALPAEAEDLYNHFLFCCRQSSVLVETGIFAADMAVALVNDGPATFILHE